MNCVYVEDNTELSGRASELVSDKFICTHLGQANHISLIPYYRKLTLDEIKVLEINAT